MVTAIMLIGFVVALAIAYIAIPVAFDAYRRYRGVQVVICPETRTPAAVEVDARKAAMAAVVGSPILHVARCEHWPEREHCGEECLADFRAAGARERAA